MHSTNEAIYNYLKDYYRQYGLIPKYETIASYFNLAGRDSVHYHIRKLHKKGLLDKNRVITEKLRPDTIQVIGDIAAGDPIETSDIVDEIDIQSIVDAPDRFWLRVKGDSMCETGIHDGDYVQIKKVPQYEIHNEDIVVAQINDAYECTLKEYYKSGDQIALKPQNSLLSTHYYASDKVQIVGKYTGVVIQKRYFNQNY